MPIYEYECEACGHRFETLQKMSDDPLKDCPECNASALRKLMSAAAFKLKGQGWYESDFKNPPKTDTKSGGGADKSKDKPSGGSEQKTSEAASSGSSDSGASKKSDATSGTASTGKSSASE